METGFIGLGNMGLPMARNLLKAGHRLTVYNRTRGRADELVKSGAKVAQSIAGACEPGIVMSMLSDDAAVEECVFGEGGILKSLKKGGVHICHATISTDLARRLGEAHSKHGQVYIAAPVFGRPEAAEAARLVVVASGPTDAVERCRPLLEPIGRKLFVVGAEATLAHAVKLGGNFVIATMIETLGEAFALMRKSGVDPGLFLEILNGSLFQSPMFETYGKLIVARKYEPAGFRLRLGLKDVRLVLAAGESAAAPLPMASLLRDNLLSGVARGMGDTDWSAVAKLAAERAGLKD